MANTRRLLSRRVSVGGRWYGPGPVPDDIADKITNPKAWMAEHEATDEAAEVFTRVPGTTTGARLAGRVNVDGQWYGPADEVPDHVAAKIRNPKAWADGVPPDVFDKGGVLPAGESLVVNNSPEPEPVIAAGDGQDGNGGAEAPPELDAKAAKKAAAKKS